MSKKGKKAGKAITIIIDSILTYFILINFSIKWNGGKYYSGTICLGVTKESLGKLFTGLSNIKGLKQTKYMNKPVTNVTVIKFFSM